PRCSLSLVAPSPFDSHFAGLTVLDLDGRGVRAKEAILDLHLVRPGGERHRPGLVRALELSVNQDAPSRKHLEGHLGGLGWLGRGLGWIRRGFRWIGRGLDRRVGGIVAALTAPKRRVMTPVGAM